MKLISSNTKENLYVSRIVISAVKKYLEHITPTYGPAGGKVLIQRNEFSIEAVDDGKRATEEFELEDERENGVIQYVKGLIKKCKDGNTTAGIIMSHIVLEAFKDIDSPLFNSDMHGVVLDLKKGLNEALKQIKSTKIKTEKELYAIAYNAFNNEEMATLIANTVFKIGKDGKMDISDSNTTQTTVEITEGLEIPKGYFVPHFTNNDEQDKTILDNPAILVVNRKINLFSELSPIIPTKPSLQPGRNEWANPKLVIVAEGFSDDVVKTCLAYKMAFGLQPLLIEAPGFGDKLENMTDLAQVVGATLVDDKILKLSEVKPEHFGSCTTVKADKDKTKFVGGKGQIKGHIASLKAQLEKSTNNFEKDKLQTRIAVLLGGIAVIKVGAYTENEQKAIKAKVENAVNSTQMAHRGGVVPGAGKVFLDIKTSSVLLNQVLKAPRRQLEENGVQYLDEKAVDAYEVVTTSLESAVSIAGELLEFKCLNVPKREKKENTSY